jgi:hypothetical protein
MDTGGAVVHITSVSGGRLFLNSFISFTMLSLYIVTPFGPHLKDRWSKLAEAKIYREIHTLNWIIVIAFNPSSTNF